MRSTFRDATHQIDALAQERGNWYAQFGRLATLVESGLDELRTAYGKEAVRLLLEWFERNVLSPRETERWLAWADFFRLLARRDATVLQLLGPPSERTAELVDQTLGSDFTTDLAHLEAEASAIPLAEFEQELLRTTEPEEGIDDPVEDVVTFYWLAAHRERAHALYARLKSHLPVDEWDRLRLAAHQWATSRALIK
jgi:hypothetical protein